MDFFGKLTGSLRRKSSTSSNRSMTPSTFSTNTASTANGSTSIVLKATPEFAEVACNDTKEMLIMASLKAPLFEKSPEDKRAPIDIVCVLDRSGSMAGEKLTLVKQAMNFVVDNLEPTDQLCIVTYDTSIAVDLAFTETDTKGKAAALKAIENIVQGGSTDLCGGLLRGLDCVRQRKKAHEISSVLLFTDGLANHGITAVAEITAAMEKKSTKGCSVFTFGFGTDHDVAMLTQIAEVGRGMYYYVSDVEKIPLSFADCLGGLQSIVAQNITLKTSGADQVEILKSLNAKYKISKGGPLPSKEITLDLGDLYSEEERDIILLIKLPKSKSDEDHACAHFTLEYFNVLTTQTETLQASVTLLRPAQVSGVLVANETLDRQRNRIEAADAMQQARSKANEGKLDEAKAVLKIQKDKMEKSSSGNHEFVQKLAVELEQCVDDMKSQDYYASEGSKKISRKEQAHFMQRSNKIEATEESFYETSSKMAFKEKSRSYK